MSCKKSGECSLAVKRKDERTADGRREIDGLEVGTDLVMRKLANCTYGRMRNERDGDGDGRSRGEDILLTSRW